MSSLHFSLYLLLFPLHLVNVSCQNVCMEIVTESLLFPIKHDYFDHKEVQKLSVSKLIVCFSSKAFYLLLVPLLLFHLSLVFLLFSEVLTRSSAVYCLNAVKESRRCTCEKYFCIYISICVCVCYNVLFLSIACAVACLCGTHQLQSCVCSLYV